MKALRSLEQHVDSLHLQGLDQLPDAVIREKLRDVADERLFVIAEALRRGVSVEEIHDITRVDQDVVRGPLTAELLW